MSRITWVVVRALIAVVLAAVFTSALAQAPDQDSQGAPIRLRVASFTPSAGERANIPARLMRAADTGSQSGYYIVQFSGPVRQQWKDALTNMGVTLLDYIPENAFKARMTADQADALGSAANVAWVGPFEPAYALSPDLAPAGSQQLVRVAIEAGGDRQAVIELAARLGSVVAERADGSLLMSADHSQIEQLAAQARDVAWVEPYAMFEKHNEYGGGQIIGGADVNNSGYDGSTQIAAVADTGLGGGSAASAHRDIPASRITAIYSWSGTVGGCYLSISDDGAVDVDSGHGTHVAGSVLSGGDPTSGAGRGVAPAAHLVFQAVENYATIHPLCGSNGYTLTGLDDLDALFQQAYDAGARIHANSWGSSFDLGAYNTDSVATDTFIWGHRDMAITFSAGNSGTDFDSNGVVDADSIGAPGTAKNVITIGASENNRQGDYQYGCDSGPASCVGNNSVGTWGQIWPSDFPASPLFSDLTAGNAEQMAAFSSRGPSDDGRIKPDLVAPGSWILSTYSDMYQQGYDPSPNPKNGLYQSGGWGIPLNAYYKYFGGTSMSNPIAAGAATVVRDFYEKEYSASASAALVKATLINSAADLLDENNDGASDNDFPIPNIHEGWGRINLNSATDRTAVFVDNSSGLSTAESYSASYSAPGGQPLKVSLVWSDWPSTTVAAINLVNNLNLTLSGPGGVSYKGNFFSGGWSATGGSADALNNVENVYVQSAAAGSWTVTVTAASVPHGPQPFALVVRGTTLESIPGDPSELSATAAASNRINLSWTASSGEVDIYKIERCEGAGCASFTQIGTTTSTSYSNIGLSATTSYSYRVRAANTGGSSGYSNTASATTPAPPPPPGTPSGLSATVVSASQIDLSWTASSGEVDSYKVERCQGVGCSGFSQVGTTAETSYNDTGLISGTNYSYRVRATNTAGDSGDSNTISATTSGSLVYLPMIRR